MNRIQLACYGLMTSAFILGGLLLYTLPSRLESRAEADQLITANNFTIMTAKTRANDESLFVLENNSQRLLIYTINPRNRIELSGAADLSAVFKGDGKGGAGGGGGVKPR